MFKTILAFIKAHTMVTAITATVVVSTVIATPIIVENYKLDKNVKENLDMLVSSDYKSTSDNNEIKNNVILNDDELSNENKSINTNEPLTFRIETEKHKSEDGRVEATYFNIVPSYDKDYSQWSKAEKEAYLKAREETQRMGEEIHLKEQQTIANKERELQLEINSWSKEYICGMGNIAYNSYTKKYKGHISKGGKWNEQGFYVEKDGRDIDVSREEFRNVIYYELMQNIKNDKDSPQSDKDNYLSQLNELYHLSD